MESESATSMRIDKLNEENFYSWRQRIQLVLALRDLENLIEPAYRRPDSDAEAALGTRRTKMPWPS